MVTAPPARTDRRAPWTWLDVLLVLAGSFLLGGLAYAVVARLVHTADANLDSQSRTTAEAMAGQLVFYAVSISIALIVLVTRHNIDVREIGWRRPTWRWLLAALPLTLLGLLVAGALGGLSQSLLPHAANTQCISVQREYGHAVLLALPVVCVAAPIVEETLFRGILYRWLRGVLPLTPAMVISGGVFALFHFNALLFLPLAGLGVLLSWIYERTQSIWPGALVHGLFNLVGVIDILTAAKC
jgi:membrane protease YdiL (CAAX protease family)